MKIRIIPNRQKVYLQSSSISDSSLTFTFTAVETLYLFPNK
ncbi:unnamed protein product, partial [Staurois parvus]